MTSAHNQFIAAMDAIYCFKDRPTLAVAVSGGADSMALLLLVNNWALFKGGKIVALTVDHGLRPESKEEASQVNVWCQALGVEHHILTWRPPAYLTSIQEAARNARYELLTKWCKSHGVLHLATAHHRGDQAETLFFRLARGSGLMGLSCMSPASEKHGVRIIRPLLLANKTSLKAYLLAEGQGWIEDPSNQNMAYTRNVIRTHLESLGNTEEIETRAANLATKFGAIRAVLETKMESAYADTVIGAKEDQATLSVKTLRSLPPEIAKMVLGKLILTLTQEDHPPRSEKLERLYQTLIAGKPPRVTLAGFIFTFKAKEQLITVTPELALEIEAPKPHIICV